MKKTTIILSVISFLLLIAVIILGVLLLKSSSDAAKLQASLNTIQEQDQDAEVSDLPLDTDEVDVEDSQTQNVEEKDNTVTYSDKSEGLAFEFPATWDIDSDLELVDDENGANRVINFHTISFTKGSSRLELGYVYVATGAYGQPFSKSQYEIVDLGSVLRVRQNGQSDWRYATKMECSETTGFGDYCGITALSIPGGRMVVGILESNNEVDIKEADAIIVDASE